MSAEAPKVLVVIPVYNHRDSLRGVVARALAVHPAVAVVGGRSCQFPTPDPGDWLLQMKAGK